MLSVLYYVLRGGLVMIVGAALLNVGYEGQIGYLSFNLSTGLARFVGVVGILLMLFGLLIMCFRGDRGVSRS